ncbi:MAG: alcohol dehydrogenase catalytic domain-containing protein [bacterium]|nr:alcohol dehydrogenase catalytic domain-containing protein [bacterium]
MPIHAYAAHQPHQPLEPFTYDPGSLGANEIEIEVTHCGLCHSDIHILDGDWGNHFPAVPGHEVVGLVRAVGDQVTDVKVGQRVGVGWQAGSCLQCEWCLSGQEQLCPKSVATCQGRFGGFADALRVDSRFAHPIPDALDSQNAAPIRSV